MKLLRIPPFISLFVVLPLGVRAGEKARGETFELAFGKEPLVYSIHQKSETKSYVSSPSSYSSGVPYANNSAPSSMTKSTSEVRYKIRLTGLGTAKNGVMTVHYEPFDYEADTDATGPAGHFVTIIRGMSVKATQNGIVIIDTDKEIGITQAKPIKNDCIPVLLSGVFDIDASGGVKDIHGDLPFIDAWQQQMKTQIGLFGFQLPAHAVTNGQAWEVITSMKSAGAVKFDGGPLNHTNTFTLLEDDLNSDPSISTIKLSAPMHCSDLGGTVEERGQSTHADMSEFEAHAFGTIHFDRKRHVLVDQDLTRTVSLSMTMLIQGRAMSSRTEMRSEEQVNLLPNFSEKSNGGSDAEKPAGRKAL